MRPPHGQTEREYLMDCMWPWMAGHPIRMDLAVTPARKDEAKAALLELRRRCKRLLFRRKPHPIYTPAGELSYLEPLWRAWYFLQCRRPELSCDAFLDVIYYGVCSADGMINPHVLRHIISIIEEAFHEDCSGARKRKKKYTL